MDPIVLKLEGGLGNQLFEFAAGYYLAGKLDTSLVLDQYGIPLTNHLREPGFSFGEYAWPDINGINSISVLPKTMSREFAILAKKYFILERFFLKYRMHKSNIYHRPIFCETDNDSDFLNINESVKLHGNFQSWSIVEEATKFGFPRIFELKRPSMWVKKFMAENNLSSSVAIHFRLGWDSVDNIDFSQPNIEYYLSAIDFLKKDSEDLNFYVFSDDISLAKKRFGKILGNNFNFVEAPLNELAAQKQYLLSKFGAIVCANSTFCSWAGWSISNSGGKVIIPFPFSDSIKRGSRDFPSQWIKMSKLTGEIIFA